MIVEIEPSGTDDRRGVLVDGDYLEIHRIAQPQQMIVRAHVGVLAAERDVDAKTGANVFHAFFQGRRDDGKVIEFGHVVHEVRDIAAVLRPLIDPIDRHVHPRLDPIHRDQRLERLDVVVAVKKLARELHVLGHVAH